MWCVSCGSTEKLNLVTVANHLPSDALTETLFTSTQHSTTVPQPRPTIVDTTVGLQVSLQFHYVTLEKLPSIEVGPTALAWALTHDLDVDLWPWPLIPCGCELWSWLTHVQMFKVNGQSVPKIDWKQTDAQTDGQTEAIAFPPSIMRSVIKTRIHHCTTFESNHKTAVSRAGYEIWGLPVMWSISQAVVLYSRRW